MSLRDVMSHADLATYPEIAMVLFVAVFAAIAWRTLRAPSNEHAHAANLPLDEVLEVRS